MVIQKSRGDPILSTLLSFTCSIQSMKIIGVISFYKISNFKTLYVINILTELFYNINNKNNSSRMSL